MSKLQKSLLIYISHSVK